MTTEPQEQHEPSMEEILSSIRRIIADEEAEDAPSDDDLGAAEARAEALDGDVDAMADAADDDSDDVLELTKMVRDSGEVVDLNAESVSDGDESDDESPADEPVTAGEPLTAVVADQVTTEPPLVADASDHGGEIELAPVTESDPAPVAGDIMPEESTDVKSNQATAELVSSTAASVATGAFAKLTQAIQKTPPEDSIADDSGRSIEQFVEDMARPMLKDWIDQHLPKVVERLVEKEIQKIARRAELM